jgi:hypothetical protein
MTIYKINPDLLKPEGASDGDVVTYVSANSRVEWAAPSGGGGDVANAWVNANDYATYISITANVNSVNSNVDSIAANLYNSYTTLTANDYNSFTTLTANIYNTFAYLNANVGGGGGGNVTNTVSITPVFKGALKAANATQAIWASTWTTLTRYDEVTYDTNSFTSVADRFTIPAGVSRVKLAGSVAGASATGQFLSRILKNENTVVSYSTTADIDSAGADTSPVFTPVLDVVEGDYFVIQAFSDTARDATEGYSSWFSLEVVEGSVLTATANLTISSAANAWVNANDFSTYSTLTANIYNTFAYLNANVGGGGGDSSNIWVNANDYNTYTTLSGLIDSVQTNVSSLYGTTLYQGLDSDVFLINSSTNVFSLSYNVNSTNDILVSISGVVQTPDQYVIASNVLTISNTTPLPGNVYLEVRKLFPGIYDEANVYNTYTTLTANVYNTFAYLNANVGGGGGGGITTGKAIAMAMIFGG